ncbi:MAG: UDP-N-acetylmuramate dehydrogenase [Legionellales bacterium]|nr:UDP-N-acetylmuramate dehydrogenase [Legionellales bacterium]
MLVHRIQHNIPLAPLTTLRLGGCARWFLTCHTLDHLQQGLQFAKAHKIPWYVLGGGSNLIIADELFPGLVLHIQLLGIESIATACGQDQLLTVQAGEPWDEFVQFCVNHGFVGVECLSGIPGSIGATPIQNVGAYGQDVQQCIEKVFALDSHTLEPVVFTNTQCQFGYRTSRFKTIDSQRFIITQVQFRLSTHAPPCIAYPELAERLTQHPDYRPNTPITQQLQCIRDTVIAIRRGKSMVVRMDDPNSRSVGSFFINPIVDQASFTKLQTHHPSLSIPHFPTADGIKIPAAWLIEQAGFHKGYRYQNVKISDHHTLALVNDGGTTEQLLTLAQHIQQQVANQFEIQLTREPVLMPI